MKTVPRLLRNIGICSYFKGRLQLQGTFAAWRQQMAICIEVDLRHFLSKGLLRRCIFLFSCPETRGFS